MGHLVWAAVVVYLCERLLRWVDTREARVAQKLVAQVKAAQPAEVPQDLIALAMNERELWAQEEMVRAMRERYETLKDWNLVRAAFGVAPQEHAL